MALQLKRCKILVLPIYLLSDILIHFNRIATFKCNIPNFYFFFFIGNYLLTVNEQHQQSRFTAHYRLTLKFLLNIQ